MKGGICPRPIMSIKSPYTHLDTFEELATKNAGVVFSEMEWE